MAVSRRELLGGAGAAALLGSCAKMHHWMGAGKKPAAALGQVNPAMAPVLKQILDNTAVAILKESPEFATSLGVSEAQAGGRYMDRLGDRSRAGIERQVTQLKATLTSLENLGRHGLSPQDTISFDVVYEAFSKYERGAKFGFGNYGFGEPTPYVVDQLSGSYINIPSFLDAQHPIRKAEDVQAYLTRLSAFAIALDQETDRVKDDAGKGVVPPEFNLRGALKQLTGIAGKSPAKSDVVVSLRNRIGKAEGLDKAGAEKAIAEAEKIVKEEIHPAFERQIAALKANLKGASHDAGIWRLKDGDQYYAAALQAWTTSRMSPEEIHQLGQDLVKQLGSEMDAILKGQGLTRGTLAERIQTIFKDRKQIYPNTDAGRAKLIADLNGQVEALQPLLKQNFGTLAKAKLEIRRVPQFKEAGSPGGYYENGALDGSRPGLYYINLRDTHEWPKFTLPTLTYHEGEPGHHWQISIAQENATLPLVRSALLSFSGYAEGWALYAEQLADEMGAYKGDPLGRLGYLKDAALRAGRLVVDTGMHAKHWSREKAIQFLIEANGDSRSAVTTEIERYCVWPGQACAYMVGKQTILRLREEAKAALGAKFDIKGFHDTILTNGSMPLSVLQSAVRGWILSQTSPLPRARG